MMEIFIRLNRLEDGSVVFVNVHWIAGFSDRGEDHRGGCLVRIMDIDDLHVSQTAAEVLALIEEAI